jgi:hypothetical protein
MTQPLACPKYTDLRKLDLLNLKYLALHAAKLERRLTLQHLPYKSRSESIRVGKNADFISLVSGGRYIFIHSPLNKFASCWDLDAMPASVVASIRIGQEILGVSQPYEEQGIFKIAMISKNHSRRRTTTR